MSTSVVIPVHGNWPVVRCALRSVREHAGDHELIVVDDGSPDETSGRLRTELKTAELVQNDESVGFGAACNQGAERARGRFLCFLNSDALLKPGALAALETALDDPRVGAAAPLLLNPDGTLQEAGGAVGREGSTYPLGRGGRPDDPAWAFRREIDYGSAACLVLRRSAFVELGGFDAAYAPAYYEDVDLCLRMADRGFRTMLEPAARVTHLQYGSASRERARQLVAQNRRTFVDRWGDRLTDRPIVSGGLQRPHELLGLRDAIALLRFLVVRNEPLAMRLSEAWPRARVTLLGASSAGDGLEHADPSDLEGWLQERRFHYWAVFGSDPEIEEALRVTQPQAARLPEEIDDLVEALVAVGVAPPGHEPLG